MGHFSEPITISGSLYPTCINTYAMQRSFNEIFQCYDGGQLLFTSECFSALFLQIANRQQRPMSSL